MKMLLLACSAALSLLLAALSPAALAETKTGIDVLETPVRSENDNRAYKHIRLTNGLQVLLISDPHADKAAAALDVAVGSGADPKQHQGLAHFLEHMLFLGTDKYPQPDEYQAFISAHGGTHNAFTSLEHTNYFFDIDPAHLEPALDRFAQFFIAPRFDEAYVEREKHAVDSEYQARIRDDYRRLADVYRELYHEKNPAATFSVGNLQTLANKENSRIREVLIHFYEEHYAAQTMRLVVFGKDPLPTLEAMVVQYFSAIPDKPLATASKPAPIFRDNLLPARVTVQSVRSERHLRLVFPLPSLQPHYRVKPDSYINYLLGHEGEGSLFQLLKSRGWAETLVAGTGLSNTFGATLDVDIMLTDEGLRRVDDVAMLFFQAVDMLKNKGVTSWQYDEQKVLSELAFRFHEKQDAMDYASELATAMHDYRHEDILRGAYMMEGLDAALVNDILERLNPDNVLMVVSAPDMQGTQRSAYYDTPYKVEKISADVRSLWKKAHLFSGIRMPEKNPFIPDKLKLKPAPLLALKGLQSDVPKKLGDGKHYNLWFMQDTQFKVPRGSVMVYARSRYASSSVREAAMAELFVRLLNDHLNPLLYTAKLGGLDFAISKRSRGIAFQLTGYSDKQGLLLKSVMDTFRNPVFDESRFQLVKSQWQDELRNASKQPPYQQLMQDIPVVLAHGYWGRNDYLATLDSIALKDVQDYVLEFSSSITTDILVYGNFYQAEALKLAQMVENTLNLAASKQPDVPARVVELPPVAEPFLFIDALEHSDAGYIKYVQAAGDSVRDQVGMSMLAQVLKSAFFNTLRTEKQFGYIVSNQYLPLARVPGLVFLVQSPAHGVGDIGKAVDQFLQDYYQEIAAKDDAWFEQQRQALLTQLQEKPRNIAEQSMEFWANMTLDYTRFDHREQQIAELQRMTRTDLLARYRDLLLAKNRRELLLVAPGKPGVRNLLDGSAQQYIYVENPDNLKNSMPSHSLQ